MINSKKPQIPKTLTYVKSVVGRASVVLQILFTIYKKINKKKQERKLQG